MNTPSNHSMLYNAALPARWEVQLIPLLLAAVHARDARIKRLEQFNHQLAVALDTQREMQAQRRAA